MPRKDLEWWLDLLKRKSRKCRTRMFVASSFSKEMAEGFADNNYTEGDPDGNGKVLVRFKFERHQYRNVNYIDKTPFPGEKEFLLPPYTVLELEDVKVSSNLDVKPHMIAVKVAVDNRFESLDLPLIGRI